VLYSDKHTPIHHYIHRKIILFYFIAYVMLYYNVQKHCETSSCLHGLSSKTFTQENTTM
jgi:hypothetical protein